MSIHIHIHSNIFQFFYLNMKNFHPELRFRFFFKLLIFRSHEGFYSSFIKRLKTIWYVIQIYKIYGRNIFFFNVLDTLHRNILTFYQMSQTEILNKNVKFALEIRLNSRQYFFSIHLNETYTSNVNILALDC